MVRLFSLIRPTSFPGLFTPKCAGKSASACSTLGGERLWERGCHQTAGTNNLRPRHRVGCSGDKTFNVQSILRFCSNPEFLSHNNHKRGRGGRGRQWWKESNTAALEHHNPNPNPNRNKIRVNNKDNDSD